jgi:hypothetical protein
MSFSFIVLPWSDIWNDFLLTLHFQNISTGHYCCNHRQEGRRVYMMYCFNVYSCLRREGRKASLLPFVSSLQTPVQVHKDFITECSWLLLFFKKNGLRRQPAIPKDFRNTTMMLDRSFILFSRRETSSKYPKFKLFFESMQCFVLAVIFEKKKHFLTAATFSSFQTY